YVVASLCADHRPDVGRLRQPWTDAERRCRGAQSATKLFGYTLVNEEPVCRRTGLAAIAELGQHCAFDGRLEIGVIGHHERSIATELHRAVDDPLGRLAQENAANAGGAGERNLAYARI